MEKLYIWGGVALAFAPSIVWLGFVLRQDVHPEKKINLANLFVWGILSSIPVLVLVSIMDNVFLAFGWTLPEYLSTLITGAVLEEMAKLWVLYRFAFRKSFFDEPIDILVYSGTVALGFAGIENMLLVLGGDLMGTELVALLILRGLTAVLVHLVSTFMLGYFLYLFLHKRQIKYIGLGLFFGVGVHGLYNFSIGLGSTEAFMMFYLLGFVPVMFYMLRIIKDLQLHSSKKI
jgi:RsiW-degrading membrane proteinase PrsW (M82 family)